jgi:hypothetical protein
LPFPVALPDVVSVAPEPIEPDPVDPAPVEPAPAEPLELPPLACASATPDNVSGSETSAALMNCIVRRFIVPSLPFWNGVRP